MRKNTLCVVAALLAAGCSDRHPFGPSANPAPTVTAPVPSPTTPIPIPPQFSARPVCTSSRLPQPSTETRTYTVVGPARDGVRSNPFEMAYGPKRAYGVWYVDVTWQQADAPLSLRVLRQDASRSVNPVTPADAKTARTGLTAWSACWEGEADDRMTLEVGFLAGTSQDVSVTWHYPSPKSAP